MLNLPVLIEIHDEMFKNRPKKEDGAVCLPDVCLGGLFSSGFLPLIISLPLRSRGPASFAVKDFFEHRTSQAWISDPWSGNGDSDRCATLPLPPDSSGMGAYSPRQLMPPYNFYLVNHIRPPSPPNETELRKPANCFYKQAATVYYLLSLAWSGLVRAACVNKNSRVFHGWGSEANI